MNDNNRNDNSETASQSIHNIVHLLSSTDSASMFTSLHADDDHALISSPSDNDCDHYNSLSSHPHTLTVISTLSTGSETDDEDRLNQLPIRKQRQRSNSLVGVQRAVSVDFTNVRKCIQGQLLLRRNRMANKKKAQKSKNSVESQIVSQWQHQHQQQHVYFADALSPLCTCCSTRLTSESDDSDRERLSQPNMSVSLQQSVKSSLSSVDEIDLGSPASVYHPNSWFEVLVLILKRSDGRDKLFKTIQYGTAFLQGIVKRLVKLMAAANWVKSLLARLATNDQLLKIARFVAGLALKLDSSASQLTCAVSKCRQVLRLCRFLYDVEDLRSTYIEWSVSKRQLNDRDSILLFCDLINSSLGCLTDVSDDVEWLAEAGVIKASLGPKFAALSAFLWLATVCIDIPFTVAAIRQLRKDLKQRHKNKANQQQTAQVHAELQDTGVNSKISTLYANGSEHHRALASEELSLVRYCADFVLAAGLCLEAVNRPIESLLTDGAGFVSGLTAVYNLTQSQYYHNLR